jgi:predicted SAM-dependent methyltransferase
MYRLIRRRWRKLKGAYHLRRGPKLLRNAKPPLKIVIGASGRHDPGWIPTERGFLDLTKRADWDRFFKPNSIDAMLAEHVWEHLEPGDAMIGAKMCYDYLKPGGYLRVAVPDGCHPNPEYIEWCRVGGKPVGMLGNDHKVLYTHRTLCELFQSVGFQTRLLEYFTDEGDFRAEPWSRADGTIWRCRDLDKRNKGGALVYTSIIMDAVKGGSYSLVS